MEIPVRDSRSNTTKRAKMPPNMPRIMAGATIVWLALTTALLAGSSTPGGLTVNPYKLSAMAEVASFLSVLAVGTWVMVNYRINQYLNRVQPSARKSSLSVIGSALGLATASTLVVSILVALQIVGQYGFGMYNNHAARMITLALIDLTILGGCFLVTRGYVRLLKDYARRLNSNRTALQIKLCGLACGAIASLSILNGCDNAASHTWHYSLLSMFVMGNIVLLGGYVGLNYSCSTTKK